MNKNEIEEKETIDLVEMYQSLSWCEKNWAFSIDFSVSIAWEVIMFKSDANVRFLQIKE